MSYTYYALNDNKVTTDIHYGYKRFKSCNAQYRHTVDTELMMEQWDFVSYAYPVMSVSHVLDTDSWDVFVTHDATKISVSTSRQIRNFLKYIGCALDIHDIDESIEAGYAENYIFDSCVIVRGEVNSRFDIRF